MNKDVRVQLLCVEVCIVEWITDIPAGLKHIINHPFLCLRDVQTSTCKAFISYLREF